MIHGNDLLFFQMVHEGIKISLNVEESTVAARIDDLIDQLLNLYKNNLGSSERTDKKECMAIQEVCTELQSKKFKKQSPYPLWTVEEVRFRFCAVLCIITSVDGL